MFVGCLLLCITESEIFFFVWFFFVEKKEMNFFGTKKVDPIDQAKEWKRNLAKEARKLDRDILALQRAEKRAIKECKIYAKKVLFSLSFSLSFHLSLSL